MKKLNELLYNQKEMVKYFNKATTRVDKYFYKKCIDEYETEIEKMRKELGLA